MSYILDALKKADTERERERKAVPGLLAQADDDSDGAARGGRGRWWAIGAIGVLLILLAWSWFGRGIPEAAPTPSGSGVVATGPGARPPAPQNLPSTAPSIAPATSPSTAPSTAPAPAPAPPPVTAPLTANPVPAQTAPLRSAPVQAAPALPPPTAAAPLAAAPARPTPATKPPAAESARPAVETPAAAKLPTREQLPPDLRAALPPLNVSGAMHAPTPRERMLFVNGLVLREGDAVAEGLTVERIGATSSVLVFRGQRFELKH